MNVKSKSEIRLVFIMLKLKSNDVHVQKVQAGEHLILEGCR